MTISPTNELNQADIVCERNLEANRQLSNLLLEDRSEITALRLRFAHNLLNYQHYIFPGLLQFSLSL